MDRLRNALEIICRLANDYLENMDHRHEPWVTLISMVDHTGGINERIRNKIVMAVHNITQETIISSYQRAQGDPAAAVVSPPLYLDVHLVFTAYFTDVHYAEGLAQLSRLIGFFQSNPWFSRDRVPDLDPSFDKLSLAFESLSPAELRDVMGMLGTKYLPSVFYKLRMIPYNGSTRLAGT